jgi:hypothetical protein
LQMGGPRRVLGTGELVGPDTPCIIPYRIRGEYLDLIGIFFETWL